MEKYIYNIKGGKDGAFPDVYVTSDTHYNHSNLCASTTKWRTQEGEIPWNKVRDFPSLEIMNETIVQNINETVGQGDHLIMMGDLAFGKKLGEFLDRIICQNLYLIIGNHDEEFVDEYEKHKNRFIASLNYMELYIGKSHRFQCFHYPIVSWNKMNKGSYQLFGHVHLRHHKKFGPGKSQDCGMDGHPDFRPYHIMKEIVPVLDQRPVKSWFPDDHHVERFKGQDR